MIKPENLLIVRTDRIGDVILSLPLAGIVKKHYPGCKVTFLVRNYTKELVENHPFIDDIIILKEVNGKVPVSDNVKTLRKYNFDSCIVVYPTFVTALIIYLSGIKFRVGTGYRWYSLLFNQKAYEHRKYAEKHELEFNVKLLKKIGINEEINHSNVKFDLQINPEKDVNVKRKLKENNIELTNPLIIFHPGSLGSSVDLPADKMIELISLVNNNTEFDIVLTGSENEKSLCNKLVISNKVKNLAGKFSLSEMISLINLSDVFVSNSTGPIHIAAALNKYTVGFYPKNLACSAKRWGPYTRNAVVFTPERECENCDREQCSNIDCMNSINIGSVFAHIEKIYKLIVNNGEIK